MKNKKGFTLIELMGVIVLMGIIALIAVPVYNNTTKKVKEKEYENVVTAIEVASERYAEKTSKMKFSVQELIDKGEYEADNEKGDVLSPVDRSIMNCYIIETTYENESYHSKLTETNNCDEAADLKNRPTVKINITANGSEIKQGTWVNTDVTLTAELLDANNTTINGYEWFANYYKISNASEKTYTVSPTTILNTPYQVRVNVTKDGKDYTVNGTVIVKIDKQNPIINNINIDSEDTWTNKNKTVSYTATDFNGSGIYGTYIGKETTCPAQKESYHEGSEYKKALEMGTYLICAMDHAGNISDSNDKNAKITISKIDKKIDIINLKANTTDYAQTKTLIGEAQDTESGIIAYAFTKEDKEPTTWNEITPTTEKIIQNYPITDNGTYYFWIKDGAGNVDKKDYTESKIDKEINTISLSPNTTDYAASKTLTGVAEDNKSQIVAYVFTTEDYEPNYWNYVTPSEQTITKKYTIKTNGTYYFWVMDKAGNIDKKSYTESKIGTLKTTTVTSDQSVISSNIELNVMLSGIKAIDSITVDNGQVRSYSINNNNLTISFKNGTPKTGTTTCDYSLTPTVSSTSSTDYCKSYSCPSGGSLSGTRCTGSDKTVSSTPSINCWCGGPGGTTSGCSGSANTPCPSGYTKGNYSCTYMDASSFQGKSCSWKGSKKVATNHCSAPCTWNGNYAATCSGGWATRETCSGGSTKLDGKCYACSKGTLNNTNKMCEYSESCPYTYYKYTATIKYVV